MKLNQCSYYTNHRFKFSMKVFHRGGQHATATTTTCWCEWGMCARLLWRKCQLQGTKKVHELLCMQLLQGIVRGQPDCECKEGCKGDPFQKCNCDLDSPPANETQAYPGIFWLYKPSLVPCWQNLNKFLKISISNTHCSLASVSSFPSVFLATQIGTLRKHFESRCHIWKIVVLILHTVFSEQKRTHCRCWFPSYARSFLQKSCIWQLSFGYGPLELWKRCLTPKLKTKIGQGFLHLLTCSTVLHLRFCLRVCYRGSNYLLGPQHQRWWKGKKWWLDCGKPGGLCKTLFFDWWRKILDVSSCWQALLGENLQQREETKSQDSVWESWMWSSR